MKPLACNVFALTLLLTVGHGTADVIYSGLQNTTIPTTYAGVNIDVDGAGGWDLNPFLGGVYLSNSAAFQPGRSGTGGLDTVLNFSTGATISASGLNFATGSGGSLDHLGTQFTAGQEGYLGFRLNGSNYGWMRVVFTNNAAGAKVLDWAYENTGGAAIQTGNVLQNGSVVTLNSAFGTFTLGSAISGANSVVKSGANTTTLNSANSYTGTTAVNAGTLLINGNQSSATGAVTVASGATLGGIGTVGGATTILSGGTLAVGNSSPGLQTFSSDLTLSSGSIFAWDLAANSTSGTRGTAFDAADVTGNLNIDAAAIFRVILNSPTDFANPFWDTNQSFANIFNVTGTTLSNWSSTAVSVFDTGNVLQDVSSRGSFTVTGSTLNWSAVPEPSSALASLLIAAGLLRRRRA